MLKVDSLIDRRFGRLVVVGNAKRGKFKELRNDCLCDCGNKKEVARAHLLSGNVKSCGCWRKEFKITHGMSNSCTYMSWEHIISRCRNENDSRFKDYGGRGIIVCKRWEKFEGFLADMGERPEGKTIDRIDNDGNYELLNCRWATPKEQLRNMRSNKMIKYKGEIKCIAEWAEIIGINQSTLRKRIDRGWSVSRAFTV